MEDPLNYFCSSQSPTTGVTNALLCAILTVNRFVFVVLIHLDGPLMDSFVFILLVHLVGRLMDSFVLYYSFT